MIFTEDIIQALRGHLPLRVRFAPVWELLYSTVANGMSFNTFIQRTGWRSPTLLLVKDSKYSVFGAFCSAPWECHAAFFGTGECFVFKWTPSNHPGGRGGRGGHSSDSAVSEEGSQGGRNREGVEVREDERGAGRGANDLGRRGGRGGKLSKYEWSRKNSMFQVFSLVCFRFSPVLSLALSLSLSHSLSLFLSLSFSRSLSLSRARALSLSDTHTHSLTRARALSLYLSPSLYKYI